MHCFFQLKPSGGFTKRNWIFFLEEEMLRLLRQAWRIWGFVGYEKVRGHCCWEFGFSLGFFFWVMNMTRNTPCQEGLFVAPWVTSAREKPQKWGNVIIPTHLTLARPHLEYFVQLWSLSFKETINHGKGAAETHQNNQTLGMLGIWKEHEGIFVHPGSEKTQGKINPKPAVPRGNSRSDVGQEEMDFSCFRANIGLE